MREVALTNKSVAYFYFYFILTCIYRNSDFSFRLLRLGQPAANTKSTHARRQSPPCTSRGESTRGAKASPRSKLLCATLAVRVVSAGE